MAYFEKLARQPKFGKNLHGSFIFSFFYTPMVSKRKPIK